MKTDFCDRTIAISSKKREQTSATSLRGRETINSISNFRTKTPFLTTRTARAIFKEKALCKARTSIIEVIAADMAVPTMTSKVTNKISVAMAVDTTVAQARTASTTTATEEATDKISMAAAASQE